MSAGARRALALSLAGGAALLLLLLARLPPGPPAPSAAAQAARPSASAEPQPDAANDKSSAPGVVSSSHAPANVTSSPHVTSPPRAAPLAPASSADKTNSKTPRVVLTKELYVAGHTWPHPERCQALGAGVRALVLVTSAPSHSAARDAVRLTWGHFAQRRDVAMAFVIGQPPQEYRAKLEEEDAIYGDLVMGNFVDSYSNLTLKTLSMLEWADSYCPLARALLKTDDDMFINVPRLLAFLAQPPRSNATRTVYGKVLKKSLPKRIPKSKYFLSRAQYPARVLPDFATGPAYLLTRDAVRPLLRAAGALPYVRLEDVFVTGILADAAHVKRQHAHEFYNKKISPHPCAVQRGISIHMVRYHEQFDLWRKLLDHTAKCS